MPLNKETKLNYSLLILVIFQNIILPDNHKKVKLLGLVWFYDISTIVGYLMPNPLCTYISNIYDLVWFGLVAYQLL